MSLEKEDDDYLSARNAGQLYMTDRKSLFKQLEFNFIEMVWGWAKSHHHRTCTYNYKDLKERLPITLLHTMPRAYVRRAARFCLHFMSGYRAGLSGPLLDFTMKKYKSHRSIPVGIVETVTQQFDEYLKAKALKAKK